MTAAVPTSTTKERPPIVVVMGHVDHGKTTLLDTIRKLQAPAEGESQVESVAEAESGGITQHIGAYEVEHQGKHITFVDTPGHEAFSAMRLRGAKVADIALLVIAADDGVRPQTKEALAHIQASGLSFIVVINKIDKAGADPERVKNELAKENIMLEGRGGKNPTVDVSAKEGRGIKELLDMILLVAELEELSYNAVLPAEGFVLESHRDPKRGVTTGVVVTNGTLRVGDLLVCGPASGKVKIMEDDHGRRIKGMVPSAPVQVVGLSDVSVAGDPCKVVFLESETKEEIAKNQAVLKERHESLLIEPEGQEKFLTIVLKADAQGTLEAVVDSFRQIHSDKVGLKIVKCDCGEVNESDVKFAEAAKAEIFAFRTDTVKEAKFYAEQKGIKIHRYEVIYEMIEDIRKKMSRLLEAEVVKKEIGRINIVAVFRTEQKRMIVGGKVKKGKLKQGAKVEVIRNDEIVGDGRIVQLQSGETKQEEVAKGNEAGVLFEGKVKVMEGDTLAAYEEEKVYPDL